MGAHARCIRTAPERAGYGRGLPAQVAPVTEVRDTSHESPVRARAAGTADAATTVSPDPIAEHLASLRDGPHDDDSEGPGGLPRWMPCEPDDYGGQAGRSVDLLTPPAPPGEAARHGHRLLVPLPLGTTSRNVRRNRGPWAARWPLLIVLIVQAALSLRLVWSNTAFSGRSPVLEDW